MIGRTLSHYEITAKLGEGGVGEVWRARDTRLDREVAIKVLPEAFTADAERIAQGPMPIDEALPIARQIAEALEAAHAQGIIHRDFGRIRHPQLYLLDLWHQATRLHAARMSADEAAAKIDLAKHADHYPRIDGSGVPAPTVQRSWELLDAGYVQPAP
jgi:serine/threonine protein kinase